jgi:type IV pilus assembly protein PilQ
MTTHLHRLALLAWGALVAAGTARAAETNAIHAIEVAEHDGAVELAIQGSRAPSYTVFKLQDPPRLVVDLSQADVSQVASPVEVGKGGVLAVSTAQYKDERNAVGRVIVALDGARRYEVAPRGDAVIVRVLGSEPGGTKLGAAEAAAASAVAAAAPSPRPALPPSGGEGAEGTPASPRTGGEGEQGTPASPTRSEGAGEGSNVLSRRVDEAKVSRPARAVTRVEASERGLLLATDGDVARIEILELSNPPRLVLDLHGLARAPRVPTSLRGPFSQVRFGRDPGKVRVVLDAESELPAYRVKRVRGGIAVVTSGAAASAPAAPAAPAGPGRTRIADVRFAQSGRTARIEISGKVPYRISRPDARTLVLSLEGAELPKRLERSLDTSAFRGPVAMVSSFNQAGTGQVKIVATLRGLASDRIVETGSGLAWTFEPAGAAAPAEVKATSEETQVAGFAAEAPRYAVSGAPQARYTGRRITLDFNNVDIRNLLRLIADVSKRNIVVADDVTGKVTVSLRNVPWDQALDIILKAKGLGKQEIGNVIRIAKYEDIAREEEAAAKAAEARRPLIPLKVRLIPVNFARASEMATRVKDVLSERGTVSTDERTNVLIVKDIAEALVRAEGLVRNLDTEIPQVLIESRIVEASSNFNRALGVQWGGSFGFTQVLGNPTGLVFPNNVGGVGGAGGAASAGSPGVPNYAVNLPAAVGAGSGGAIGLVFGSAGGAINLNLRLTALENSGVVKTVSAPKIATIDNREAIIGQGISIPFSQVSASGVNTTFIEAKLELKVTPHVSADGSILLKIKATNNAPNPQLTGANGQPSISKREAETEVLVKDGETTVIGGIYTRQTADRRSEVPFFGKIPILGYLFRTTTEQDDHTELLIFITPRILNRPATSVAAGG